MPVRPQAAKEAGNVEIFWKGPLQENDTEGQINVVQEFITKKVDGLVLAPLDSQALIGAVKDAKRQGIPTVIFDSALGDESDHRELRGDRQLPGRCNGCPPVGRGVGKQNETVSAEHA